MSVRFHISASDSNPEIIINLKDDEITFRGEATGGALNRFEEARNWLLTYRPSGAARRELLHISVDLKKAKTKSSRLMLAIIKEMMTGYEKGEIDLKLASDEVRGWWRAAIVGEFKDQMTFVAH